jgi:hypothetical protein
MRDPSNSAALASRSNADRLLGKIILGYGLLDGIMSASGAPNHPLRRPIPRTHPLPDLTYHMKMMLNLLIDWPKIIPRAIKTFESTKNEKPTEPLGNALVLSSQEQSMTACALSNLSSSIKFKKSAKANKILSNIHTIAFLLCWYSKVRFSSFLLPLVLTLGPAFGPRVAHR